MLTCLTCLRALPSYVPTCLRVLNFYVHVPSFSRAYVPINVFRAYLPPCLKTILCLHALIFHVLTSLKSLISTLCNNASKQLNNIGRIQKYVRFKEKEVLLNNFVYSNFNYCPLVWHFCSSKSSCKIEKIQEWAYRLLHNDFASDYAKLLKISGKATMEIKTPMIFCTRNIQNCE